VAEYRFYALNSSNRISDPPEEFDCPNDAAAIEKAAEVCARGIIEVWQRERLVIQLQRSISTSSATSLPTFPGKK